MSGCNGRKDFTDLGPPKRRETMSDAEPIRDAATIIVVRNADEAPSVLMGQRGKTAVFMPDKFVFPGGRVDAEDGDIDLTGELKEPCLQRLAQSNASVTPHTLAVAAIRELWEETGFVMGRQSVWRDPPSDWSGFAEMGFRPAARQLKFFFRALTPPGRPRRFDARFFVASENALANGGGDIVPPTDELSHLQWVPLSEVRQLNLAFITQLVLAELQKHLPSLEAPKGVPFVRNDALDSKVIWL